MGACVCDIGCELVSQSIYLSFYHFFCPSLLIYLSIYLSIKTGCSNFWRTSLLVNINNCPFVNKLFSLTFVRHVKYLGRPGCFAYKTEGQRVPDSLLSNGVRLTSKFIWMSQTSAERSTTFSVSTKVCHSAYKKNRGYIYVRVCVRAYACMCVCVCVCVRI